MGEAKRRREEVRKQFLEMIDWWSFEPTEWEREAVEAIDRLPVVRVRRYPPHILKEMGMPPQKCHANARFMEENDPRGIIRRVNGWRLDNNNYVLHSVIDQGGGAICCVTPSLIDEPDEFDFRPDDAIEWREDGEYFTRRS
jgi:hypothetical protein